MAKQRTAGRTKWIFAFLLLFSPAFILVFIGTRGCSHKFTELDDYGQAIDYQFRDADGKLHTSHDFKDKVVLVSVLQNTCPEDCSISFFHLSQMIYQHVRKNKKKLGSVRIISFVTDGEGNPVNDLSTVKEMMEDNVEAYDPEIWYLAEGDAKQLYDFENNDQKLLEQGEEYYGGEAFQELLLLLDRENHLRMVLSGKTEGMIRRMKEHIALLQKQYDKENAKASK